MWRYTVPKQSKPTLKHHVWVCHGLSLCNWTCPAFLLHIHGPETVASAITVVTAFLCGYSGYIFGTVPEHNLGFCSEGFYWIFWSFRSYFSSFKNFDFRYFFLLKSFWVSVEFGSRSELSKLNVFGSVTQVGWRGASNTVWTLLGSMEGLGGHQDTAFY